MSYCRNLGLISAELEVKKRGYPPLGGGEIKFTSNTLKVVKPFQWLDQGKVSQSVNDRVFWGEIFFLDRACLRQKDKVYD